jgi:hypothetical protein
MPTVPDHLDSEDVFYVGKPTAMKRKIATCNGISDLQHDADSEERSTVFLRNGCAFLPDLTLFYRMHQTSCVCHVSKLDFCLKKKSTVLRDASPLRSARNLVTFCVPY